MLKNTSRFENLAAILSRIFEVPLEQIKPEASLAALDRTLDNTTAALAVLAALVEINERFDIDLPLTKRSYETVADMLNHIEELLQAKQHKAHSAFEGRAGLRRETKRLATDCQPAAWGELN